MIRLVVTSISVMTLIIGIGYLPGTYAVQTTIPVDLGGALLLSAADEAEKANGEEGRKRKMRSRESIGSRVPSVTDSECPAESNTETGRRMEGRF